MTDTVLFLTTPASVGATATSVNVTNVTPDRITVGALASGTIAVGQVLVACQANNFNLAINAGTTIISQISGTPGGAGVYALSRSQTDLNVTYPLAYFMTPQSWTVPDDFGPVNTVECLAGGAQGGPSRGEGGGGGTYAKLVNASLTPGSSVGYIVGPGVSGVVIGGTSALQGYDTAFGLSVSGPLAAAKGGISGAPGNIGQNPVWSTGTTIHVGGHTTSTANLGSGGGGGAAGPNGIGGAGDNPGTTAGGGGGGADGGANASGGNGGASFGATPGGLAGNPGSDGLDGSGAGGGIINSAGGGGSEEPMWTSTLGASAGPGSGGGGAAYTGSFAGGPAGGHGGGGGGGGFPSGPGGAGTQGIIVITYTPATPTVSARHPVWID